MKVFSRIVMGLLLVLLTYSVVSAHAKLVKANPSPNSVLGSAPTQVQLWFDEPIELNFSSVQVLDAKKQRVDTGVLQAVAGDPKSILVPLKPSGDGTYNVIWKVLSSADGHITSGVFAYGVGSAVASVSAPVDTGAEAAPNELSPVGVVMRWVSLASLLALVGGFVFRFFLLEPSLEGIHADKKIRAAAQNRWLQLTVVAFVLFFIANVGELGVQAQLVTAQVSLSALGEILFGSRFGTLWLIRAGLMALCAVLLGVEARGVRVPFREYALIVLGNVALFTRSLNSHGAAAGNYSLPVFSDWAHLVAVAVWVGGLFCFAWLMPALWRALEPKTRSAWIAKLIPQFSVIAIVATIVIAVTGMYNSTQQIPALDILTTRALPSLNELAQGSYDIALGIKVALFLVMLLFGALNLLFLSPRFRRFVAEPEKSAKLFSRFRVTVAAEALLGLSAIFLAGIITLSVPPRSQPDQAAPSIAQAPPSIQPVTLVGYPSANAQVQLKIGPDPAAPTEFTAQVTDKDGKPLADVQRVIFNFMYLDQDTGAQNVNADAKDENQYGVTGQYLSLDGMWKIKVTVRQKGRDDVAVEFPYYIAPRFADTETTPVMTAQLALTQAQQAMNSLKTLRSEQQLNDGVNGVAISDYEYQAPDRTRFVIQGQGESIAIGAQQYYQDKDGNWFERARVENFVFPQFNFADSAQRTRLGRTDKINNQPAQIILFDTPSTSGQDVIHYAYWIGPDKRVLQLGMVTTSHYMMQYYTDFDSTDVVVNAPAKVLPAPTPVTVTGDSGPLAAAVQGSARPRGFVTGDLEGDGALVMVVVGVVILLIGSGGKRPRNARLVVLGTGAAAVLLGIGLFIDAVNGTMAANQNVPVNTARASTGEQIYQQNCQVCHGEKGYGDGPGAAALPVKPFDLTTHVLLHDEQYLHAVILNGRGYMPAFGDKLSQDQILDVIAYTRLLARNAQQGNGTTTPARAGFTPQP